MSLLTTAATSDDQDYVATDTLKGAIEISAHIGKTGRQTTHLLEQRLLPAFKIGRCWHMRRSTYQAFIERLEAEAISAAIKAA
jgi:hypothetical protein